MSVLAKEIMREVELSGEYIHAGFDHSYHAGELIAEVENLVGADQLHSWLSENCKQADKGLLRQSLRLFKGETIEVQVYKKEYRQQKKT